MNNNNSSMNIYPGMVNNVYNIFGMRPDEYNVKLFWLNQQELQEQLNYQDSQFNSKRKLVDDTDNNIDFRLKKCKKW